MNTNQWETIEINEMNATRRNQTAAMDTNANPWKSMAIKSILWECMEIYKFNRKSMDMSLYTDERWRKPFDVYRHLRKSMETYVTP